MPSARNFLPGDADGCLAVMRSNMPEFFLPEEVGDYASFLVGVRGAYFVVEDVELAVAACGGYHVDAVSQVAGLTWGMVHRDRHGQGLGTLLLRERLRRIAQEGVAREVRLDTSQRSRPFFERFGFETRSCVLDGYGPGLDRYDMRLVIELGEERRSGDGIPSVSTATPTSAPSQRPAA
jgi:GNAT superfamily N-acetyltransferase